ncbi:MAG: HD domain-containing protein [Candidatus Paceibacterota bacterium]|jgi:hypothetical protein
MKYKDRIYGKVEINEPVILDLINCSTLQRLKEIDQAGYFEVYFPKTSFSRFEHSIGVFLLLKSYNAPIEEQIAGLIHDVSHSAFSHCIDYVLDSGSEEEQYHQDNIFNSFVKKSEIPDILKKHNIDLDYILNDNNFPLKERDLPDLCADRIDYSIRTSIIFNEIKDGKYFLNNLETKDNHWFFKSEKSGEDFAKLFLKINSDYFAGLPSAVMFWTVGKYLRYAISKGYISEKDLYTTDKKVLNKISKYLKNDAELKLLFDRMNNKISFENNPNNYEGKVSCKSRVVDPLCWHGNKIKRVSEIKTEWKEIIERESKPKGYFLKFER